MAMADVVPVWKPWVAVDALEDPPSDALCRLRAGAEWDDDDEEEDEEEDEENRGTERSWMGERDERNESEAERAYRLERRNGIDL